MKHFQVKFIRNTDHPQGRKVLETYVAAETKAEAKVKASRYLFEQDGEYALFYKAPRLEEISVALYLSKTEQEFTPVDDAAIKQYCALLSLFDEEESYSEGELRDAETLLNNPEREEAEDVAHYDALPQGSDGAGRDAGRYQIRRAVPVSGRGAGVTPGICGQA